MTEETLAPPDEAMTISSAEAMDAAFAGHPCQLVQPDGAARPLATDRWSSSASAADIALLVEPCTGPTLDLGCGPGRLAEALQDRDVDVVGIDVSAEAVRQARRRGVTAVCRDFFADHADEPVLARIWHHIVLADGNVGLGGDPARLLRRAAGFLVEHGTMLVEVGDPGTTAVHRDVHLQVAGRRSGPFDWATVGCDRIGEVAAAAGLRVARTACSHGRHVATLVHGRGR